MEGFECINQQLKLYSVFDRKPMQIFKYWCYVAVSMAQVLTLVKFAGFIGLLNCQILFVQWNMSRDTTVMLPWKAYFLPYIETNIPPW